MPNPELTLKEMLTRAGEASDFLKALSNQNRLVILCNLLQEELSVGALNEKITLSQSALSQHLAILRRDGLVATRRDSQTIYYSIADPKVKQLMGTLYDLFCQK